MEMVRERESFFLGFLSSLLSVITPPWTFCPPDASRKFFLADNLPHVLSVVESFFFLPNF